MSNIPPKILLIDDEESILFAMNQYLTDHGYQVECAADREEAEARLQGGEYSVVITDLDLSALGQKDGLEIVRLVAERSPETRIILLTAYGSPQVNLEAKERGADAVLSKPLPLAHVAEVVFDLLGHVP